MIRLIKENVLLTEDLVSGKYKKDYFSSWYTENNWCIKHGIKDRKASYGQACIRGLKNSLPLCTKEIYMYPKHRNGSVQYDKNYDDLKTFQDHNIPLLDEIEKKSLLKKTIVILPRYLGGQRAMMPESCAVWLKNRLNNILKNDSYQVVTTEKGSFIKVCS